MKRLLRLLLISTWREILQWFAWRAFLLTLAINQAITPLLGLVVWSVVLPGSSTISTYYVALLAVQLMTVSYEDHTFSNSIYNGTFGHELLKPQPPLLGPLGTNLAVRIWHFLFGLPLILFVGFATRVSFDVRAILLALPALVLAALLRFLFTYLLALSAFWTEQAFGIVGLGGAAVFLLGGSAAPITLLPTPWRALGETLPFRAMLGFPAEIMSSSLNGAQILNGYTWQILWTLICVLIVMVVWRVGLRRYTAPGG